MFLDGYCGIPGGCYCISGRFWGCCEVKARWLLWYSTVFKVVSSMLVGVYRGVSGGCYIILGCLQGLAVVFQMVVGCCYSILGSYSGIPGVN